MRNDTIGSHQGQPTLTSYDPIKNVPGTDAYNAVSGPTNPVQGAAKPIADGAYTAVPVAGVQVGNVFANVQQPSVPRRVYIPTVTL